MNQELIDEILRDKEETEDSDEKLYAEVYQKTNSVELKSASNIVSRDALRKIQKRTLNDLAEVLANTYGPMGSNTLILRGNSKETLVAEYSKDGAKVLKASSYANVIEMSIQTQISDITKYTDSEVGDGTTSATLLSDAIFEEFCNLETSYPPYTLIKLFKQVVAKIQDKILEKKQEVDLNKIYDICLISTNGNEEIADKITNEIYAKYGLDVYINPTISNTENDIIRVFDGLTLDEGNSDPAYINTKNGTTEIRNPKIYAFNDPIDTPEMISFAEKIIDDNIIDPDDNVYVPTVIICPKMSRDASPVIEKLVDFMYSIDKAGQDPSIKPPITIITNLLGGNNDKYLDIAKLCGCKMIRKYIDPRQQQIDIEKGIAATPENIHDFAGSCELFKADSSSSKFINPSDMYEKDETGLYVTDENGEYIRSITYSNILKFVEDAMNNAKENNEDDNTVGALRKRLQSLKANYVEYMVGGITIADRDSARDLIQDAIKNCRSACANGYGYAANYEGFRAAIELYDELEDDRLKEIDKVIIKAYKNIITKLYSTLYPEEVVKEIIKDSLVYGCPLNMRNGEFDSKVITSIQTDIKILDAISKIVTIMFTANQCLVQAPSVNIYQ